MPDEAFEIFWHMRGGPELIALHDLFAGLTVATDKVQQALGLTQEQLRVASRAAESLGVLESTEHSMTFFLLAPDSSQRGRLDWCLEPHAADFAALTARLRTQLLVRFLSTPPAS